MSTRVPSPAYTWKFPGQWDPVISEQVYPLASKCTCTHIPQIFKKGNIWLVNLLKAFPNDCISSRSYVPSPFLHQGGWRIFQIQDERGTSVPAACSNEQASVLGKHLPIKQQATHIMSYSSLLLHSKPSERVSSASTHEDSWHTTCNWTPQHRRWIFAL